MADMVRSFVTKLFSGDLMVNMVWNCAAEELANFKNLEDNMQILERKIGLLDSRKTDVVTVLQGAEVVSGKKRKREVEDWLEHVDEKRRQIERLRQEVQQTRAYNIVSRRHLAKQVVNEINKVAELAEQGRFPEGVVLDTFVKENVPLVTSRVKGLAFERNFGNLWALLMDDEVLRIGIYGMGGVGKTTLAMHLHNRLLQEPKFSKCVYWVTVSQEFSYYKLQKDIAQSMGIGFSGENDEKKRAGILSQELSKTKFVLILDDVWSQFDVNEIGLPLGTDGCKLLITSRSAAVCRRIPCQNLIKVEALSELEAWELFQEKLGPTMLAPEIEETAQQIAKRCGGLPLGIITMARSMRAATDIHEWENVLEELKESCMDQNDMGSEVMPVLLCSFNRLRDPKLQHCFLYCSLYPEDYEIPRDELINKFIIEELIDRRSRQAEFHRGHAILNELENSCLLLGSQHFKGNKRVKMHDLIRENGNKRVKMHDLIREMALRITRDNPRFMVKAGVQLKEIPEVQDWKEDLNKVSLMRNKIKDIPTGTSPMCPGLSTLSLRKNPLSSIPDSFFVHMCGLKNLDLSKTKIEQLPNSISDLVNLKALLLGYCKRLISLPSLEKLKELRELDLSYTKIKEVRGMDSLANLKCLNLNYVPPAGTLQRLSRLQRLILPLGMTVAVEEVEGLRHLEEFQGTFCGMSDLTRFIKSQPSHEELSRYVIGVGNFDNSPYAVGMGNDNDDDDDDDDDHDDDDDVRLTCKKVIVRKCGLREIEKEDDEIMLPRNIEVLCIEDCEAIECIMRLSSADTFCHLRELEISDCARIKKLLPQSLVDNLQNLEDLFVSSCEQLEQLIEVSSSHVTLPRLRRLTVYSLPELKSICISTNSGPAAVGVPPPESLFHLRQLNIHDCKRIKKLLPQSLLDNLQNLDSLWVSSCEQLEQIIEVSSTHVTLPRLRYLTLEYLPELKSIYISTNSDPAAVGVPPPGFLSHLRELNIRDCKRIKELLPQSLLDNLQNLEELLVSSCEQLEQIIEVSSTHATLPQLRRLKLESLPELKSICISTNSGPAAVGVPPPGSLFHLRELDIRNCARIKKLLPQSLLDNLQNLETLWVSSCEQLEQIIEVSSTHVTLPRLRHLTLEFLPELKSIYISTNSDPAAVGVPPPGFLFHLRELNIRNCKTIKKLLPRGLMNGLQSLEDMCVWSCDQMEMIGEDEGETNVHLPRLRFLVLVDLPELKSISKSTIICDSIEMIQIYNCAKLKKVPLFCGQTSAPRSLKAINILKEEREWWNKLEWDHLAVGNALQPFVCFY